jgi:hypothetical protein
MVFHDLAGWVMMPMALGMLFFLQWLLAQLFVTEDQAPAVVAARAAGAGGAVTPAAQPLQSRQSVSPRGPAKKSD